MLQTGREQYFFQNVIFYIINSFILSVLTAPYFLFNAPQFYLRLLCPLIRSSAYKGAVPSTLRNTGLNNNSYYSSV